MIIMRNLVKTVFANFNTCALSQLEKTLNLIYFLPEFNQEDPPRFKVRVKHSNICSENYF
jgi:hypothetical protein